MSFLEECIRNNSASEILLIGFDSGDVYLEMSKLNSSSSITYINLDIYFGQQSAESKNLSPLEIGAYNNFCNDLDSSKIKADLVYLDFRVAPEKIMELLGPVFEKLSTGAKLIGNNYKYCSDINGVNQILLLGKRYGNEVYIDEGADQWTLTKQDVNISFIIPAYNCANTLDETLTSIIATNFHIGDQIVIVNDGSTDFTLKLVEEYRSKYDFIKVIQHPNNRGGAAARNTAVENADNPLIFCLDSDNVLEKNSICKLKNYLIRQNADIASFQRLYFFKNDTTEVTHEWIFNSGLITFADSLSSGVVPISSGNYLFTRRSWEVASGYPLFSRALDAWGFGIRQLGTGQKMVVLKDTGYFHRYGHASYWVREQSSGDTSRLALQLLAPFIGQLEKESILYLFDPNTSNCWFENLANRPLKLMHQSYGTGGIAVDPKGNEINPPLRKPSHIHNKLLETIKSYFRKSI